jgi:hypothetical protein
MKSGVSWLAGFVGEGMPGARVDSPAEAEKDSS